MYVNIGKIKKEVTMVMLLEYYGINLRKSGENNLVGTCPLHHGDNPNAFHLDTEKNLFNCFTHCGGGSMKSQLKKADKSGADIAVILGEDELDNKQVTIKYLREKKDQKTISFEELAVFITAAQSK